MGTFFVIFVISITPVVALFSTPKLLKKVSKKGSIVEKRAKLLRKIGIFQKVPKNAKFDRFLHIS